MKKLVLLLFFCCLVYCSYACMCIKDRGMITYQHFIKYDNICHGKVIGGESDWTIIEVIEKFKGNIPDTIKTTAFSSCSAFIPNPNHEFFTSENWILYYDNRNIINADTIDFFSCARSFSFPLFPDSLKSSNQFIYNNETFLPQNIELEFLRQCKKNAQLQSENTQLSKYKGLNYQLGIDVKAYQYFAAFFAITTLLLSGRYILRQFKSR